MEQREELEIETRLRAALAARSELVTHSTLRPGIPPNEHTAGLKTKRAGWWSWRRLLVPATVAAALGGGVFVGAQLNGDSGKDSANAKDAVHAGGTSGGTAVAQTPAQSTGEASTGVPSASASGKAASPTPAAAGEVSVGTLRFTAAAGWQVTAIDATSACVAPKGAATPGGSTGSSGSAGSAAGLPCGLDALYLKSDAAPDAWPRSTATKATGWWPQSVDAPSQIVCPTAKRGAANHVADSVSLRSSTKYVLGAGTADSGTQAVPGAAQPTAEYHEWAVTCDTGAGVRPMLWELTPAGGAAGAGKAAVATVVSSDPAYDAALMSMVGTLHLAG